MKLKNAAGRFIETEIAGINFKPFTGAKKYTYNSKIKFDERAPIKKKRVAINRIIAV